MNHDATHCFDYTKVCPKSCYRAKLTEDLYSQIYQLPTSWAHFRGTKECPRAPVSAVKEQSFTRRLL